MQSNACAAYMVRSEVTVQGVCSDVHGSQGQKILEKASFLALGSAPLCSGVLNFHKKFSPPIRKS